MSNMDTEWMATVCYARAAGAPNAEIAGEWARAALGSGDFRACCEAIDRIALPYELLTGTKAYPRLDKPSTSE